MTALETIFIFGAFLAITVPGFLLAEKRDWNLAVALLVYAAACTGGFVVLTSVILLLAGSQ